ncbi:PRC-barrel domain-containing protein [Rhodococcus sp. NPDC003318]|uniref:PRC-barrel domain-containing protein n=1 Tax=Rhodococcus sp. NPDC003318 TaxID=3364503 RepID=UPI0036ADAE2D
MRLSDLIGAATVDGSGTRIGTVVDVRFEIGDAGPPTVVGVLVGPRFGGSFLGYERRRVRSPAPIAQFLRWRERGAFLVLWRDVHRVADGCVTLREGYTRYSPVLASPG